MQTEHLFDDLYARIRDLELRLRKVEEDSNGNDSETEP